MPLQWPLRRPLTPSPLRFSRRDILESRSKCCFASWPPPPPPPGILSRNRNLLRNPIMALRLFLPHQCPTSDLSFCSFPHMRLVPAFSSPTPLSVSPFLCALTYYLMERCDNPLSGRVPMSPLKTEDLFFPPCSISPAIHL